MKKKTTRAQPLKPKLDAPSPTVRHQDRQEASVQALSAGRSDALDHGAILDLQKSAGNASVSSAIQPSAQRAGASVSSIFAAQAPDLFPLIPAGEIKALQERFDVSTHNADVDRRYEQLKKQRALSGSEYDQSWDRKLSKLWAERRPEPAGPAEAIVPTMAVLDPAILQPAAEDGMAEAKFRQSVVEQLFKTPFVSVVIGTRGLSAMERGDDATATTREIVLKLGDMTLPHTKGRVTFADLTSKAGSPYAQQYARDVTNSPDVMVFRYRVADLEEALANAEVEHADLQARGKSHPIVKTAAEILGGPSIAECMQLMLDVQKHPEEGTLEDRKVELEAPEPPLDIWNEPTQQLKRVNALIGAHHFKSAAVALGQAQQSAAVAFESFERYERRMMKGAGVAVKWLEAAKEAGKLAVGVATGELGLLAQAGLAGAYTFAQGVAEHKEGQTVWQLTKASGIEAAMSLIGGGIKGSFEHTLNERFAAQLEKYPELAEHVIKTTSEATTAFYKTPIEATLKKIAASGKVPSSPEELADMVAKEAMTEIGAGGMGESKIAEVVFKVFVKSTEKSEEPAKAGAKGAAE